MVVVVVDLILVHTSFNTSMLLSASFSSMVMRMRMVMSIGGGGCGRCIVVQVSMYSVYQPQQHLQLKVMDRCLDKRVNFPIQPDKILNPKLFCFNISGSNRSSVLGPRVTICNGSRKYIRVKKWQNLGKLLFGVKADISDFSV